MIRRFLALAASVAFLLVGCSSRGHDTPPATPATTPPTSDTPTTNTPTTHAPTRTAPATPTVPANVPRTGPNVRPGENPPVMPVAATKHTPQGAAAFAKFFMQTIDWGFATTSGAYMRHYYQPTCTACANIANGIDKTRAAGGHYIGSRISVLSAAAGSGAVGGPHGRELSITVTFNVQSGESVDSHGKFLDGEPAHHGWKYEISLAWRGDAWTVVYLVPVTQ